MTKVFSNETEFSNISQIFMKALTHLIYLGTQQTSQLMFCNIMILCNKLLSVVIKGNQNFFYDRYTRYTNELRSGWRTISFIRRLYKSFLGLFLRNKSSDPSHERGRNFCVCKIELLTAFTNWLYNYYLFSMMVLLLNPNFILRKRLFHVK